MIAKLDQRREEREKEEAEEERLVKQHEAEGEDTSERSDRVELDETDIRNPDA